MNEMRKDFEEHGYVIVPSILDKDEVIKFRTVLEDVFNSDIDPKKGDRKLIRNDVLSRYPDIQDLFFQEKIFKEVKKILGKKIIILPEVSVMESQFGGWHKDTTSVEVFGYDFHKKKDFNMVNLAIYLQDNDEFGGGLDVVPRSHLELDPYTKPLMEVYAKHESQFFLKKYFYKFYQKILTKFAPSALDKNGDEARVENFENIKLDAEDDKKNKTRIQNKAGDMVIFDLRLDHKATWPKKKLTIGNHKPKYALFAILAGERVSAEKYKDYILSRASKEYEYQYLFDMKANKSLKAQAKKFNAELI